MFDSFIVITGISAILGAVTLAPFGCIMMWNRISYISDAFAHSSLLGVVIALMFDIHPTFGVLIISLLFGTIYRYVDQKIYKSDIVLSFLAIVLFASALIINYKIGLSNNLENFIIGDILLITRQEIFFEIILSIIAFIWLKYRFEDIISIQINYDIAIVEGINPKKIQMEFVFLLGVLIGVFIKLFGIILISSMLIIPSITVRHFSREPIHMLIYAALFGVIDVVIGCILSYYFDIPASPVIIIAASGVFLLSIISKRVYQIK